jgi:type III secretory pathway component EscV
MEFPQLSVLSYQELSENLRIQPIARVALQKA